MSLGIGDTTQPVLGHILSGLRDEVQRLGSKDTYIGYGDGNGRAELRETIALYGGRIDRDEVVVSDSAKCDIDRLQYYRLRRRLRSVHPHSRCRSIFEIDGAKQCDVEVNSFSKYDDFSSLACGSAGPSSPATWFTRMVARCGRTSTA